MSFNDFNLSGCKLLTSTVNKVQLSPTLVPTYSTPLPMLASLLPVSLPPLLSLSFHWKCMTSNVSPHDDGS
jgi:hypothetical protein